MRENEITPPRTDTLGRVLIMIYLVLALAATARASYQFIAKFDEAPLAYTLSLIAGVVYIVATIALMRRRGFWRTVAWAALLFEAVGVLTVGTLSIVVPALFAHDSVWSHFGAGYLYIPLVLPIFGMVWLAREGRALRAASNTADEPLVEVAQGADAQISSGADN